MNKQEMIDKAVIELKGKFPQTNGYYIVACERFDGCISEIYGRVALDRVAFCETSEYVQRAKELGYINGFQWGVEYPTNGVKPDLPDDLKIRWHDEMASYETKVGHLNWKGVASFEIIDGRYKPIEQRQPEPTHGDWYDYESQKAVALPPLSEQCEWKGLRGGYWVACEVIDKYQDSEMVVFNTGKYRNCRYEILQASCTEFRPLDWNRKAEQERNELIEKAMSQVDEFIEPRQTVAALVDAGWRPTK